jgi:phosphatidylinositol glycan class M
MAKLVATQNELIGSNLTGIIWLALGIRVLFLFIGLWVDSLDGSVRYTDIDYAVYDGAARSLLERGNPYEQETYRYPPLLALLIIPNHLVWKQWGKLVFIFADVLLIPAIQHLRNGRDGVDGSGVESRSWWQPQDRRFYSFLWAINPLSIVICTRGSSDSLVNYLLLWMLVVLLRDGEGKEGTSRRRSRATAGLAFGLLVHMRIYPVIYVPALAVHLYSKNGAADLRPLLVFFLSAAGSFLYFTTLSVVAAGHAYWSEAVMYHLTRVDHRHNFSIYFYPNYLSASTSQEGGGGCHNDYGDDEGSFVESGVLRWLPFLPQALLLSALALRLAQRDLCRCLLLSTMAFVAYNKVVTAQYFTWYCCLLPVVLPPLSTTTTTITSRSGSRVALPIPLALALAPLGWVLAACVWLWRAYLLEMTGQETFLSVHLAGMLFHIAQVAVLAVLLVQG